MAIKMRENPVASFVVSASELPVNSNHSIGPNAQGPRNEFEVTRGFSELSHSILFHLQNGDFADYVVMGECLG